MSCVVERLMTSAIALSIREENIGLRRYWLVAFHAKCLSYGMWELTSSN
jgi:hypothetical protein